MSDYTEMLCDDLKNAMDDLENNRDDESYDRVRCTVRAITVYQDELVFSINKPVDNENTKD